MKNTKRHIETSDRALPEPKDFPVMPGVLPPKRYTDRKTLIELNKEIAEEVQKLVEFTDLLKTPQCRLSIIRIILNLVTLCIKMDERLKEVD